MDLGLICQEDCEFGKRYNEYVARITQAGASLSIEDIRNLYALRIEDMPEKEAAKEIGQFLVEVMDAWEQSNIDGAIVAAHNAYEAKLDPEFRK